MIGETWRCEPCGGKAKCKQSDAFEYGRKGGGRMLQLARLVHAVSLLPML